MAQLSHLILFPLFFNLCWTTTSALNQDLNNEPSRGINSDGINMFLCSSNADGVVYTSPDCSQQCACNNGQFKCDDTFQCSPNAVCEDRDDVLRCYCNDGYDGDGVNCTAVIESHDCQDIYDRVSTENGIYQIKPAEWQGDPFDVYCNMTDGKGWTVFQRRVDGFQDFFLYWSDYKVGFGSLNHEFWLGNDKLHSLTTQDNYELRVDLMNSLGNPYYAKYSSFRVSDESDNYRLTLGSYSGNGGDSFHLGNGQAFTTRDRDNDQWSDNCAVDHYSNFTCGPTFNGAWWYTSCAQSSLNSPYGIDSFYWWHLPEGNCNIKYSEMKVRRIR